MKMESLNDRRSQMYASLCMGLVFIFVGIPIWWKTTEVYRADLPYSEIQGLVADSKLSTKISIKIASNSEGLNKKIKNVVAASKFDLDLSFINLRYEFETVIIAEDEIQRLKSRPDEGESSLHAGNIMLVFISLGNAVKPKIFLSGKRIILVEVAESEIENVATKLMNVISENIVNAEALNDAVSKAYGAKLDFSKESDFHMRKTVQPDKGYDIVFSLLCPEPKKLQASWNIQEAIDLYLNPMISKLGNFAEFHIGSQVLYYSGLSVKPKSKKQGGNEHFYLTHQQLSHVVNPIESRLGSQISPNPTLNFIVYMTEDNFNPLYIQRDDGSYSTTNTFLVPRWGAIMIKNSLQNNDTTAPRSVKLDSVKIMEVFIAQLRSLLGLEQIKKITDVEINVSNPGTSGVSDLELDYLIRARTFENIATSIHTINSLAQLLEKIHNIVINDNIAGHIYAAVNAIKQAKVALLASDYDNALNFSNIAFKASETAFFDPTLLELLYFPEDQKFAIYIPLFLPISLPLLGSLVAAIKWLKAERLNKNQKSE